MSFFGNSRNIWLTYAVALGLLAVTLAWFSYTTIRLDLLVETNRRQIEKAQKEAIYQERISYALWRMDWLLTPLVAQEAARNHWMYEALIPTAGNASWLRPELERQQRRQRDQSQVESQQAQAPTDDVALQAKQQAQDWEQNPQFQLKESQTGNVDFAIPPQVTSPLVMLPTPFVKLHFQIDQTNGFSSPQVPQDKAFAMACEQGLINETTLATNRSRLDEISAEFQFHSLLEACSEKNLPEIMGTELVWSTGLNDSSPSAPEPIQAEDMFIAKGGQIDELVNEKIRRSNNGPTKSIPSGRNGNKSADYDSRAATANQVALSQRAMYVGQIPSAESRQVAEGVMRAIWYQNKLLLARRVQRADQSFIQGCWLDWDAIKAALLKEIAEIVPHADLVPRVSELDVESNRALATLPVDLRIIPPPKQLVPTQIANERMTPGNTLEASDWAFEPTLVDAPVLSPASYRSLVIAWGGFLLTALSTAWLIAGVIQLSERRSAFASAVTHELRTPLTTFRLYSEMLDGDMVGSQEQRQLYTKGLVAEADRLSRLVDNVLQFSRLERKQAHIRKSRIQVMSLLNDVLDRCRPRMASSNMECELSLAEHLNHITIETSKDTVEQIVFNLIDNACKYAGTEDCCKICLAAELEPGWLVIRIRDFGPGIDRKMIKRLFRPFARSSDETAGTASGVGLGLSLSRQLAKQIGGRLDYQPAEPGCLFELRLRMN
jgi:signal transduction histidine kinase